MQRLRIISLLALTLALSAACTGPDRHRSAGSGLTDRVITPALWAGGPSDATGPMPAIDVRPATGGAVRGPIAMRHPVDGEKVRAYELRDGALSQLLTVTQGGAALGRVVEQRDGRPELRFSEDVVFPLGHWRQGEVRRFEAVEHTLFGPAAREITVEIIDLSHVHEGVPGSLSYRLSVRDAAGRLLSCEFSVYSPGRGRVLFDQSSLWDGGSCPDCPCDR